MEYKGSRLINVLNGYRAQYPIENLHVIDLATNSTWFSGNVNLFVNSNMDLKQEVCNFIVKNVILHNDSGLFIFI